jgi:hypothetical protein
MELRVSASLSYPPSLNSPSFLNDNRNPKDLSQRKSLVKEIASSSFLFDFYYDLAKLFFSIYKGS